MSRVLNVEADLASRKRYALEGEWQLNPDVFIAIESLWGKFDIDLFATRLNTQCEKYYAWKPDPGAIAFDAFIQSWEFNAMYAFPPFSIINRVLSRLQRGSCDLVVVLPLWPTQTWFARALHLAVDYPRLLPMTRHLTAHATGSTNGAPIHQQTKVDSFQIISRHLQATGLPGNVATIILQSWRDSTKKQYQWHCNPCSFQTFLSET